MFWGSKMILKKSNEKVIYKKGSWTIEYPPIPPLLISEPGPLKVILRYESSTLILYKELSSSILQSL